MILKQIVDELWTNEQFAAGIITFREKDALCYFQQCKNKYQRLVQLTADKNAAIEHIKRLKEELSAISPEALEQLQKDCQQKNSNESSQDEVMKSKSSKSRTIVKPNRKRKLYKATYH